MQQPFYPVGGAWDLVDCCAALPHDCTSVEKRDKTKFDLDQNTSERHSSIANRFRALNILNLDEFQTLLGLALFLLATRPHHQRAQGQLDSLRLPAISYYAQNSHFHPRLAEDLWTSNAHKQSKSKVYVKHLSIEGLTANPIIHAPFMQLICNITQYPYVRKHCNKMHTKCSRALFWHRVVLETTTFKSKNANKTSLRFHWLLHGTAWWWLCLCQKQSEYGTVIWQHQMSTRILTSSERNMTMQPVVSM